MPYFIDLHVFRQTNSFSPCNIRLNFVFFKIVYNCAFYFSSTDEHLVIAVIIVVVVVLHIYPHSAAVNRLLQILPYTHKQMFTKG